jgi:hypothetical protein
MNTKGRRAFNGKLFDSRGGDFSEGVAAVKKGDTWGYIDKTGNFVIRPQFLTATQFSERVAAVESPNHKWHYINHDGRAAFNEQFDGWCVPFKAGIAWFEDKAGHCHFIDRNGKALFVLDNKYAFVHYPITGDRILVKYRAALPNPNFPPKDSED